MEIPTAARMSLEKCIFGCRRAFLVVESLLDALVESA